ncbi:MFS transporter [Burkholderia sp. WAC0059]|uniref:MFS transporter n=1 Tax=Burkholderia sp. WAC0059 TaxID=2066022 RepID=UPI000C7ED7E5|nr:MFS transporter [Burkholderia sp. WAC0059]PLZ02200.1 MFS transporter [Burkholderia sp. WAC0059]
MAAGSNTAAAGSAQPQPGISTSTAKVIAAASIGTIFEWYDFTLYGSLATVIASRFFAGVNPVTGFIFALLTFGVGFIMRPVGAVVFGRIGDMIGRKRTFLVTIVIMGISTVGVGCLPGYASLGLAAPILLIGLRMLQGLALGGEYGGAATYVAEHSPRNRRGLNTSWISATGTIGLLLSFAVVLVTRVLTGPHFDTWGWRIPFIFSVLLVAISVRIRMRMEESPAFQALKNESRLSRAPLTDTFLVWANVKRLIVALFAICGGMTCVYYTAVLFPTFFLTHTLKVDPTQANVVVTLATFVCMPLFLLSGWLCDRFGRKPVLLASFLLTMLTLFPIFHAMTRYANPALAQAQASVPVWVEADARTCSFMFNPLGSRHFTNSCDIAREALTEAGVSYETRDAAPGAVATVHVGSQAVAAYDGAALDAAVLRAKSSAFGTGLRAALDAAGFPRTAAPAQFNTPMVCLLLVVLLACMTLALTPTAPALIEMFPTRIRYTSMSFPYHFASGWIGGLLPTISFALSAQQGDIYFGLWYPVAWIAVSFVVALLFLKETKDVDLGVDF